MAVYDPVKAKKKKHTAPRSPARWTAEALEQLTAFRDRGLTQKAAGLILGIATTTVSEACIKNGIPWHRQCDLMWTPERKETLRSMVAAGETSTVISQALGISRSAVCGQARRMGMNVGGGADARRAQQRAARPPQPPKPPKPPREPKAKAPPKLRVKPAPPPPPLVVVNPTPFMDLARDQCRWPIHGEGADMICCGSQTGAYPYCAGHRAMAFQPAHPKTNTPAKLARSLRRFA